MCDCGVSEIAEAGGELATKPDGLNSIPGSQLIGENLLPRYCMHMCAMISLVHLCEHACVCVCAYGDPSSAQVVFLQLLSTFI